METLSNIQKNFSNSQINYPKNFDFWLFLKSLIIGFGALYIVDLVMLFMWTFLPALVSDPSRFFLLLIREPFPFIYVVAFEVIFLPTKIYFIVLLPPFTTFFYLFSQRRKQLKLFKEQKVLEPPDGIFSGIFLPTLLIFIFAILGGWLGSQSITSLTIVYSWEILYLYLIVVIYSWIGYSLGAFIKSLVKKEGFYFKKIWLTLVPLVLGILMVIYLPIYSQKVIKSQEKKFEIFSQTSRLENIAVDITGVPHAGGEWTRLTFQADFISDVGIEFDIFKAFLEAIDNDKVIIPLGDNYITQVRNSKCSHLETLSKIKKGKNKICSVIFSFQYQIYKEPALGRRGPYQLRITVRGTKDGVIRFNKTHTLETPYYLSN